MIKKHHLPADVDKARAALLKLSEGKVPDVTAYVSVEERLAPFRDDILRLSQRYRWQTIATWLADPDIAITVAASTLRRHMARPRRKVRTSKEV